MCLFVGLKKMQNRPPQTSWESEQAQLFLYVCAAVLLCWLFFDSFVFWTSWILYWLWMMVDFPVIHVWVAGKINLLAELANQAKEVSFEQWLAVMNQTSGIFLIFLIPLVLFSGLGLALHPMLPFRSKRLINIHTLPGLVSAFAPTVIPILAAAGRDGLMNDTSPEHAWALKPEEFAEQHQLIRHKVINRAQAISRFEAQVGRRHEGRDSLAAWAPHERALFAIFGAQVFLDDRKSAMRLLDDLNRSCLVRGPLRRKRSVYTPVFSLANKLFNRVLAAPGVEEWLATHQYVASALFGLYARDLRLQPPKFRWLKGIDRTLWYALHTANSAKVFVEGSGVAAQARAEIKARAKDLPPPGLFVNKAVDGLQAELETLGLVFTIENKALQRREKSVEPVMDAIYAPSEPGDMEGS